MNKYISLLLAVPILAACNNEGTTNPREEIIQQEEESTSITASEFWDWFESKSDDYYHLEENTEELFNDLSDQLFLYDPGLTFVFSTIKENGRREFVVSADGIKSSFPAVESLVDKAPELEQWEIIAFRPRVGTEYAVQFNDLELKPEDVFFIAGEDEEHDAVGLDIYIRDYDENDDRFISAFFLLLDNAVGEYDSETKIGYLDFHPIPNDTNAILLQPWSEVTETVDNFYNN